MSDHLPTAFRDQRKGEIAFGAQHVDEASHWLARKRLVEKAANRFSIRQLLVTNEHAGYWAESLSISF